MYHGIYISPAVTSATSAVQLSDNIGYNVTFTVAFESCDGKVTYQSKPYSLQSGSSWNVPAGGPGDPQHRVVVFTVEKAEVTSAIRPQAALESRQGCSVNAARSMPAPTIPAGAAPRSSQGHQGVTITPSGHTYTPDVIGVVLALLVVLCGVWALRRKNLGYKGSHR